MNKRLKKLAQVFALTGLIASPTYLHAQEIEANQEAEIDIKSMTEWRQGFHANPETAYEEIQTSKKVTNLLSSWGIETHDNIGKTGVVGVLHGKKQDTDASICLRADMDALPITERNQSLPYSSKNKGKMHACGHDGHTAMLLGAAKYLSQTKNFNGTVNFIFQPAEEGGAGAKEMMKDGLFNKVSCDQVYGLHTWPDLPLGKIAIGEGNITASHDRFTVKIKGKGGHSAFPEHYIDSVSLASEIIMALHELKNDNIAPEEEAVLSITKIHGGEALNAMPETVELGGSVRTFTDKARNAIEKAIHDISSKLAKSYGASIEINYKRGYPSILNNKAEAVFARNVAAEVVGKKNVLPFTRTRGSEDFSYFSLEKPSAYIALGQGKMHPKGVLHSPLFDFNDAALPLGAEYWVKLVERSMPLTSTETTQIIKPKRAP